VEEKRAGRGRHIARAGRALFVGGGEEGRMAAIETSREAAQPRWIALGWTLLRAPLLLALLYLFRAPVLDLIESTVDIVWIAEFAIQVLSTPASRMFLWAGAFAALWAIGWTARRYGGRYGYASAVGAGVVATAAIGEVTGGGLKMAAPALVLLGANWAPLAILARVGLTPPRLNALVAWPPAIAEGLFASRWLGRVQALALGRAPTLAEQPALWPGAALTAAALAVFALSAPLAPLERALRDGPNVRVFATGNFNGLALDATGTHLFATGHGAPRVLRYATDDLAAPPIEASVETGGAQGLAYDPAADEVYVFNTDTRDVLVLAGDDLALKRTLPAPELSPGDPWILIEPHSDTITLASEADAQTGSAIVIFDRATGAVRERRVEEAGNLLTHPDAPILYMSFFRRWQGVIAYDLSTRQIVGEGPTDSRMDRLAYDPARDELLATSPVEGRILRFDARTLAPKGAIGAMFGVRVLAVDATRGVVLAGSLATGKVAMIDLATGRMIRDWYLGPWLRSIVVRPDAGVAYVSSQGTLYELRYADAE